MDGRIRFQSPVHLLCSGSCLPRNTGAKGAVEAASYLASELMALGLEPAGTQGFIQEIPLINGSNVLGTIQGRSDRFRKCSGRGAR